MVLIWKLQLQKNQLKQFIRGKDLEEFLSFSSFPLIRKKIVALIKNCNKRCDIWHSFMVFDNTFKCMVTGKYCKVKGSSSCSGITVAYLITCQCYKLQCVGSAIFLKKDFA